MDALLYLISDENGVEYVPVGDRIVIGGDGSDSSLGKSWLKEKCLDIFAYDSGYGILRCDGPQRVTLNGMELPAGESFLLTDGAVMMVASPDLQDYFIILFSEEADTSEMNWMKGFFGEFTASRELPFGFEDGQWKVLPESTDMSVRDMSGHYGMKIGKKVGAQEAGTARKEISFTKFSVNLRTYLSYCFNEFIHQKGWLVFPGTALIMLILLTVLDKDEMFVYYSETRNGLFCITCAAIWVGIFNSVQSICKERAALKHEHMQDRIYFGAYVLAHVIYETFLCLMEAGIIQIFIMAAFRKGLTDHPVPWIRLYVTLVLILISSDTMGLLLSGIVKNATTAMTVMPFLLIMQLVMAGVIFELSGAANTLSYITVAKWGMTALCSCVSINDLQLSQEIQQAVFHHHFNEYSSGLAHLISIWAAMLVIAVVCTVLTTWALRLVDKDRR